jgi:hypothetical protein
MIAALKDDVRQFSRIRNGDVCDALPIASFRPVSKWDTLRDTKFTLAQAVPVSHEAAKYYNT